MNEKLEKKIVIHLNNVLSKKISIHISQRKKDKLHAILKGMNLIFTMFSSLRKYTARIWFISVTRQIQSKAFPLSAASFPVLTIITIF